MTKQEISRYKKEIKERIKTMELNRVYELIIGGVFFDVMKIKDNLYELVIVDDLLSSELKINMKLTKHNLINIMINEIEKKEDTY